MSVFEFDPLSDGRWQDLLQRHARASVFHSRAWLDALRLTYGYEPVAYTTNPPGAQLRNAWVFCRIQSWLTGRRLVSLPFSDHCDPLLENPEELQQLSAALLKDRQPRHWRYIECRSRTRETVPDGFRESDRFVLHKLNLEPELTQLFDGLHKSSTQRKIKRAEREGLTIEEGYSEKLLDQFYDLLKLTRRRHRVPPQPRRWFSSLQSGFGDQLKIQIASSKDVPIAGILTIQFKESLVYKYGASNEKYFSLGGMQMLFWRAITAAKQQSLNELDLGRSDLQDRGLITFKDRLGAASSDLVYFRHSDRPREISTLAGGLQSRQKLAARLPAGLMSTMGRLLYRHFG